MIVDAEFYRRRADEARRQAGKAADALDKERWLEVADEWLKLAAAAERERLAS